VRPTAVRACVPSSHNRVTLVKFGIRPSYRGGHIANPDDTVELARLAEDAGCESVWAIEHVVVPDDYASRYPYSADARMGLTGADAIPDPLDWLAFVAAVTSTLRLATGVLILPEHNPVVLAKRVATVDALSNGRLLLGIGVGWLKEESDAVGVRFADRGRRTDEYIAAMRALWRDRPARFDGEHVRFADVSSSPPPAQPGGVPIIVGGRSAAAVRRAGRLGDGYFPIGVGPDELPALLEAVRREASAAGRDPSAIEVTVEATMDLVAVRRYEDLGVVRAVLSARGPGPDGVRVAIEKFHANVMSRI
jgi:probable F420-dependent oxidoreductase